jgi:sodium-coupled neutral amino acid transporter 2
MTFPFLIRILLTFVSIFSLYSVHLLLKTANEGGRVAFLTFFVFSLKLTSTYRYFSSSYNVLVSCFCVSHIVGSLLYEQLGYKAFGLVGKLAASGSITMQNIGGKNF